MQAGDTSLNLGSVNHTKRPSCSFCLETIRGNQSESFVPRENRTDAILVADTQKSHRSSLSLHAGPNAFVQSLEGTPRLQLHYTEEEACRSIRAYVTTLLGSLRCRTDVQVAGRKGMLLRYVTSHVTKMHDASTSKGLYSSDVSGYQAANSFL